MSSPIDIDRVESVLLLDGWHHVFPETFDLGVYTFAQVTADGESTVFEGGTGFSFSEGDSRGGIHRLTGPISSVLAVRYTRQSDHEPTQDSG